GGGVAVLLELIKTMAANPWNCTIDFVFFDREENGLLGSQFYIRNVVNRADHFGMINLDIEGMGDEVFVGPVGGGDDNFLMPLVRKAAKQTKFDYKEEDVFPGSDYASFAQAGLENISISVVPKGDPELLARMVRAGGRIDPKYTPQVMTVMHTPNDKSSKMSPQSLEISYEFTSAVLQLINHSVH
ncbi:MAG TPA: M28 family peptidase, partial [Bacteroidota bacterium]|nr:M28 family peptidase [Bacteroidota bacterium]